MSVCLSVFPIITQEPLDRFDTNFDLGTGETHGNVHSLVLRFKVEWVDFKNENLVPGKIVQVRVNGAAGVTWSNLVSDEFPS